MSFERWRRFGERIGGDMTSPSFEVEFVIEAARGLARFGFSEAARRFLSSAAARLHDLGCASAAPRLLKAGGELDLVAPGLTSWTPTTCRPRFERLLTVSRVSEILRPHPRPVERRRRDRRARLDYGAS